ncbi:hypothetical protein ACJJIQ_00350 [Microbulbifer sp. ANSA003]|uniref:hypothetical protein n=1 Tax=Microbulbifer sp. ANSA003 TaxID=3243360 RepID=UPI004041C2CC
MIEDVVEGIFRVLGRFIGQIFIEIIFEILLKGPGYFISKQFTKRDPDPDGFIVVITGFVFWVVVGFGFYCIYSSISGGGNA